MEKGRARSPSAPPHTVSGGFGETALPMAPRTTEAVPTGLHFDSSALMPCAPSAREPCSFVIATRISPSVDCRSFVVMTQLRVRHALTLDRHFEQMKFVVLPVALTSKRGRAMSEA